MLAECIYINRWYLLDALVLLVASWQWSVALYATLNLLVQDRYAGNSRAWISVLRGVGHGDVAGAVSMCYQWRSGW